MKYFVRISYVLIIVFTFVNFSYAQQYSAFSLLSPNKIDQTTYSYGGSATYLSSGYDYGFSSIEFSGDNPYTEYHEIVTFYKFSLSFLPSDAYNINAKVMVYRTSGSGNSKFVLASDIAHPNNDEDKFNAVILGSELFDVDLYSGTWHNITSYVIPRISQGFINFGVKRSEIYMGQVSASILVEWDAPSHITAKNNFENGTIKIGINQSAKNKNSPYPFTANVGQTVNLQAVDQNYGNYDRIWNDTEAPLNKSKWVKINEGQRTYKSANSSFSFNVSTDDAGVTYEADLRKICDITFQNHYNGIGNGGPIQVNGSSYTSPTSTFNVVEQNEISASYVYHVINGIEYMFDHWSDGSTVAYNHKFYPTQHITYTAYLNGRPNNSYRNLHFNGSDPVGTPIKVMWNQHPNTNVTKYEIWRHKKNTSAVKIATVNRNNSLSSYTYTDYDYSVTHNTSTYNLLYYDVRAFYSVESTYAEPSYAAVYGEMLFKHNSGKGDSTYAQISIHENNITNFPNPFNPTTQVSYQLKESGHVTIKVYDLLGKEAADLVDEVKPSGKYNVTFNGAELSSGIYFLSMRVNNFYKTQKIILAK